MLAFTPINPPRSYFVTELLGTDLHRLLTSRPLEKQFIQYFLYQIMVRPRSGYDQTPNYFWLTMTSAVSNMSTPLALFTVT